MSSKDRSDNSLCENSMKMVVNILKLSSFSIAKMSLGTTGPPVVASTRAPVTHSVTGANKRLPADQIPGSRRSQGPQSSSKPLSFVMKPGGEKGSSYVLHRGNSVIDKEASDYISKVHEKNRNDADEESKLSPCMLPAPRAVN